MGRRRRKEREEANEDRDKTIEPDKPYAKANAIAKSATSIYLGNDTSSRAPMATRKERTPFRLHRNHSDRSTNKYRSRPELSLLQAPSTAAPSTASRAAYEPVYDSYSRMPNRYNDYGADSSRHRTRNYGCYEGRDRDKENSYKSKYEPGLMYADLNHDGFSAKDRERRRFLKYKRTGTAAAGDRRYTTNYRNLDDDIVSPSTSTASGGSSTSNAAISSSSGSRYGAPRKSHAYQRSQTQMFFDSEASNPTASTLYRTPIDTNNNHLLEVAAALADDDDEPKSEQQREREARRKEIQGLIMKYAQIDDIYNRATEHDAATTANNNKSTNHINVNKSTDYLSANNNSNAHHNVVSHQSSLLPLSKTQSVSVMPSSSTRSRIPKTLSTFVRTISIQFSFIFYGCYKRI